MITMEIRKVQKTGGSSYVITLPKTWITSLKIKEKDKLAILSQPDGTLLVTADLNRNKINRTKNIEVNDETEGNYLLRSLIGSYIMGFGFIKINSTKKLTPEIRRVIMEFTKTVIGFEIVEETLNSILIKDLLNPTQMPFDKSIKRMNILVRTMHEDVMMALNGSDAELARDVIDRDIEINRRYRLIARQSNMVLHDVILAQKMSVTLEDAHHYFLVSKQLERVGDHAKILSENVQRLIEAGADDEIRAIITKSSELSIEFLKESLQAWEERDLNLANQCIENIEVVKETCEKITRYAINAPEISVSLGYIAESINRTAEYAVNIAEIVFDNLLKD